MGIQVQLIKTLCPIVLIFGLQKFDIAQAGYAKHCRGLFLLVQVTCFALLMLVRQRINGVKETDQKVHVPALKSLGTEVKPASVMTVPEYDHSKWREQVQQLVVGGVLCFGIHLQWNFVTPIAMQILMTPVNVLDSPLLKVYLFGRAAKGELVRPWASPNPLGLQGTGPTAKERKHEAKIEAKKENRKKK